MKKSIKSVNPYKKQAPQNMNFNELKASLLTKFKHELKQSVTHNLSDSRAILEEAIQYSVTAPGKRIRPLICMAIEQSLTQTVAISLPISIAIELIHCYSLIHDDLPAMDNDDFRRGNPTCHKAFGEDMAILACDILNTFAFEYLSTTLPPHIGFEKSIHIIKTLANACGIHGMGGGQALDLKSTHTSESSLALVEHIHHLKTGRLLSACFTLTSVAIEQDERTLKTFSQIGHHFGLLFQIIDDILDATGKLETIGKSPGKDSQQNKLTYVSLLGVQHAKKEALKQKDAGLRLIETLATPCDALSCIFEYTFEKGVQYAH